MCDCVYDFDLLWWGGQVIGYFVNIMVEYYDGNGSRKIGVTSHIFAPFVILSIVFYLELENRGVRENG